MRKKIIFWSIIICLIAFIYGSSVLSAPLAPDQKLFKISYISVGRGDSALIQDPSGYNVLIDGGQTVAAPTVVAYLRQNQVKNIDVMIASHTDGDHVGGLTGVLNAPDINVEQVWYNGYNDVTTQFLAFKEAVQNRGLSLRFMHYPQTFQWGKAWARVLNPSIYQDLSADSETNQMAVVILLQYGQRRFLFPGDIDATAEATVIARRTPLAADILKVAHHGSAGSSSPAFLSAVQPRYAIISVGPNSYGLPEIEAINRLQNIGAIVLRTDYVGTIVVVSDGYGYSVNGPLYPSNFVSVVMHFIPTDTPIPVFTQTPTLTATGTYTPTITLTPTITPTGAPSTATSTPTSTLTPKPTRTLTSTPTPIGWVSPTPTPTASRTNRVIP